jgi:hypothetical protein
MRVLLLIMMLIFDPVWVFGQHTDTALDSLQRQFKSFEYEAVIANAKRLLQDNDAFTSQQKIEILRMKAIAHYALNEEELAAYTFTDILRINPEFLLDPVRNSPKIIDFFKKVRADFSPPEKKMQVKPEIKPTRELPQTDLISPQGTLLRSVALPGWGHLYSGRRSRGYFLGSAALASLLPAVYFSWQTARNEKDYLNATDQPQIQSRYDKYNQSYKFRNTAIAFYGAVWLYAQFDLFTMRSAESGYTAQISPAVALNQIPALQLSIRF